MFKEILTESINIKIIFDKKGGKIGEDDLWGVIEDEAQIYMNVIDINEKKKSVTVEGNVKKIYEIELFTDFMTEAFPTLINYKIEMK
jgi:thioredoxin-related protein